MNSISIIIPVYNAEKYLTECLDSIIAQSYRDFEVILVNDGSRDRSLDICNEFAARDCRIKVIDKPNGGVSSARNCGIQQASGEWITFIDSDDWVDHNFLDILVHELTRNEAAIDWVTSGLTYKFIDSPDIIECPENPGVYFSDTANGLFNIAAQKLITSPVGKLYCTKIIKSNNLTFNETISFGEDRDFNLSYLRFCRNCVVTDFNGYNYRKNISTSLSTAIIGDVFSIDIKYWSNLYKVFKERGYLDKDVSCYLINRLYNIIVDNLSQQPLFQKQHKFLLENINWQFVKQNSNLIIGNRVLRFLFKYRMIKLIDKYMSHNRKS